MIPINDTNSPQWRKQMETTCRRFPFLGDQQNFIKYNLWINDKHKYIFCSTPKVASSSWKVLLLRLDGKYYDIRKFRPRLWVTAGRKLLSPAGRYKPLDLQQRLEKYYKFMFVREPLERLVSAYKDKCLRVNYHGICGRIKERRTSSYKGNTFTPN